MKKIFTIIAAVAVVFFLSLTVVSLFSTCQNHNMLFIRRLQFFFCKFLKNVVAFINNHMLIKSLSIIMYI